MGIPKCITHSAKNLVQSHTQYGIRWSCPVQGCTVVAWQKYGVFRDCPISVPANYSTRQARRAAHEAFDSLWKSGIFKRSQAYKQLAQHMCMETKDTHIAQFNSDQCSKVMDFATHIMEAK